MARLPVPRSTPKLPEKIFSADQFGAQQGAALQDLGGGVSQLGGALRQRKERKRVEETKNEISELNIQISKAKTDIELEMRDAFENASPGDSEVGSRVLESAQERFSSLGDLAKSDAAKDFLRAQTETAFQRFRLSENTLTSNFAGEKRSSDITESTNQLASGLISNPDGFEDAVRQTNSALAVLAPREAAGTKFSEMSELAQAHVNGLIFDGRAEEAVRKLEDGELDEFLDGALKTRLLKSAKSEVKSDDSTVRRLRILDFKDDAGQIALDGDDRGWTRERVAALGKDEVESRSLVTQRDKMVAIGSARESMDDLSLPEIAAAIDSSQNNLSSAEDFEVASAGFVAQAEAAKAIFREYSEDAARATIKRRPAVDRAFKSFSDAPSAVSFAEYAERTSAAQLEDNPGVSPKLIPKSFSDNIADQLSEASLNQDGGAERAGRLLKNLQDTSGARWPEVARDLFEEDALTPEQYVAANVQNNSPSLSRKLLRAGALKTSQLAELAGPENTLEEAKAKANAALSEFNQSMVMSAGGAKVAAAYNSALAKIILSEQASGQRVSSRKAKKIAKAMVLKEFNFDGVLRIPSDVNKGAVKNGLRRITKGITNDTVISPADSPGNYASRIRAAGTWITNSDQTGAKLVDEAGAAVMEMGSDGRPIQMQRSWDDITAPGEQTAPSFGFSVK